MISQFYILSPRGDTIIHRDFRGEIARGTAEIFFRKARFWAGDAPPVFQLNGIHFVFIKRNGLFFVCTTNQHNASPSYLLELVQRMTKVFKDFCGVLSEEAIRKNFVLIYELLDEMIDFGYPQITNTQPLKECVQNEAVLVEPQVSVSSRPGVAVLSGLTSFAPKTVPSNASHRPIGFTKSDKERSGGRAFAYTHQHYQRKNEIFVDILERISVILDRNARVTSVFVDGSIQIKSFLSSALPTELRLALNEDLTVGSSDSANSLHNGWAGANRGMAGVVLDDCNFNECVDLSLFDNHRILSFIPQDGEFALMNYRVTSNIKVPFKIFPFIELPTPHRMELTVKIRADIPEQNYGGNITVSIPIPKYTVSVATDLYPSSNSSQSVDFNVNEHRLVWYIKKLQGGYGGGLVGGVGGIGSLGGGASVSNSGIFSGVSAYTGNACTSNVTVGGTGEVTMRARLNFSQPAHQNVKKEIGPIAMQFEIPMYNASNLQVRYLRLADRCKIQQNPFRWVRYVVQSNSYVCRL